MVNDLLDVEIRLDHDNLDDVAEMIRRFLGNSPFSLCCVGASPARKTRLYPAQRLNPSGIEVTPDDRGLRWISICMRSRTCSFFPHQGWRLQFKQNMLAVESPETWIFTLTGIGQASQNLGRLATDTVNNKLTGDELARTQKEYAGHPPTLGPDDPLRSPERMAREGRAITGGQAMSRMFGRG